MPNYSLVANSTFQPFTYQELAVPLDRQELYHEKLAEEYDKLSSQADILEAMGSNDRDRNSGVYNRYKSYSDALRQEADNLYRHGLNTESRQRLSDLRRRYNTDIVPIQNAWNKREEEAKMQMSASLQNPSIMFTRDAQNSTLDEYIKNPTGGFGVINGANITKQMSEMAKNLAKQVRSGNLQNIDEYTYNYIQKFGLDENLIRNWQDSPTLSKMFEQVMQANGVTPEALEGSMNAQRIIDNSRGYAEMGMWNAMGEDKTQNIDNYGARLNAQMEKELQVAQQKAQLDALKNGNSGIPTITSDGVGLKTSEQYNADGLNALSQLKGGQDGLKASYFGRVAGSINPLKIYDEYQEELRKSNRVVGAGAYARKADDQGKARETVLKKYAKYGVTDILSKDQYDLLKGMGYDSDSRNPGANGGRYSTLEKGFNGLVQQQNRYSVNMTKYDSVDEDIRSNLSEASNYNTLSGRLWAIESDGKEGKPLKDAKDLNLYSADNTKGNKVNGIYYDPQFKGKIVFRLSDGKRYTATPDVLGNEVSNLIKAVESDPRFTPKHIAAALYEALNRKNKVQGETDSKI